jgi:hypothetical protein
MVLAPLLAVEQGLEAGVEIAKTRLEEVSIAGCGR